MDVFSAHTMLILAVFIIGYICITLEHFIKINKAATALIMGIICWVILFIYDPCPKEDSLHCFLDHLASISQIILFLFGALAIVEIINIHHGFKIISDLIHVGNKKRLLWVICVITFFLSSILDNLTTTIVMVTLLAKLLPKNEDRLIIGGGVVIAANAGGAWTPIGDVTTTMLWIGGQLSTVSILRDLILPSLACLIVAIVILSPLLKGSFQASTMKPEPAEPMGNVILFMGAGALVFVPIFKLLTGLPPFMGVLFGLAVIWVFTDWVHKKYPEREYLSMPKALARVDLSSTLFFLGILLAVDALDRAHLLERFAVLLDESIHNTVIIATLIGLISAVVDNVPLVAASMGMYSLEHYPADSQFWDLIAFCAGTGGSILIIGSAAGVVYMGLEDVDFFWYIRRISFAALMGYAAGIVTFLLQTGYFFT
jgi:Na+/H+ antiporter NhaD/arsenite permease-like protein